MTDTAGALDLPLLEVARRIEAGSLSPVSLTEAALERISRLDRQINSFVTVTREVALAGARKADDELRRGQRRGPLHGIPYALKDNIDTQGIRTTWGATPYSDRIPERDATVVRKLRDAGAVLLGKLTMVELAGGLGFTQPGAAINGACRNPWDTSRWAGGSSSGSAAAVAAGLVGFALGTETVGSLMNPAAHCGVTAFRPTYGTVSRSGVLPFSFTFDKVGPICRSVEDCAAVLAVISGHDPLDETSIHAPRGLERVNPAAAKGLRVAVLPLPPFYPVLPAIEICVSGALITLQSMGLKLEAANLPDLPWREVADVILLAETEVAFDDIIRSRRTRELADPMHRAPGRKYGLEGRPSDYVKAMAIRAQMQRIMAEFFDRYDLVVHANNPVLPPPVDQPIPMTGGDYIQYAGNLLGLPTAAIPIGFVEPGKLPVSLGIAGRPGDDARVLAAAALFQSGTRWHLERPPLARSG